MQQQRPQGLRCGRRVAAAGTISARKTKPFNLTINSQQMPKLNHGRELGPRRRMRKRAIPEVHSVPAGARQGRRQKRRVDAAECQPVQRLERRRYR